MNSDTSSSIGRIGNTLIAIAKDSVGSLFGKGTKSSEFDKDLENIVQKAWNQITDEVIVSGNSVFGPQRN